MNLTEAAGALNAPANETVLTALGQLVTQTGLSPDTLVARLYEPEYRPVLDSLRQAVNVATIVGNYERVDTSPIVVVPPRPPDPVAQAIAAQAIADAAPTVPEPTVPVTDPKASAPNLNPSAPAPKGLSPELAAKLLAQWTGSDLWTFITATEEI